MMDQSLRNPVQYYDQQGNNAAMNGFAPDPFPGAAASLNAPPGLANMPGAAAYGMVYRENGMPRYGMSQEQLDMQNAGQSPSPFGVAPFPNQRAAPIPDGVGFVDKSVVAHQNSFNARRKMEHSNGSYPPGFDAFGKVRAPLEMDPNFSGSPAAYQANRHNQQFNTTNPAFQSPTQSNALYPNFGSQQGMPQTPSSGMDFMLQQQQQQQQQQFSNYTSRMDFQRQQQQQQQQQQIPDGMYPQAPEGMPQEPFGMMPQQGPQTDAIFSQQQQQQQQTAAAYQNATMSKQQMQPGPGMPNYSDPNRFNFNNSSPQSAKSLEGATDNQKQAAMMAAAAVRAAAAASARQRSGYHPSPASTPNSFGFGQRRVSPHDASGSPFGSHGSGMQSPNSMKDFPAMSPGGDVPSSMPYNPSQSPFGQHALTQPPPYSSAENAKLLHAQTMSNPPRPNSSGPASRQQKLAKQEYRRLSCDSSAQSPLTQKPPDPTEMNDADMLPELPVVEGMDALINSVASEGELPDANRMMSSDANNLSANNLREQERKSLISPTNKSSAPPTPLSGMSGISPVPSPFQDDLDLDSLSPSWPQAPSSPNPRKLVHSHSPSRFDQLSKLYEVSDDEERRDFLDKYLAFMSINGTPVTKVPIVSKQPLDLYRLCRVMVEKGGLQEVIKKKRFRDVLKALSLPFSSSSVALTVKNQYIKYMLPYENKMKDQLLRKWQQTTPMPGVPPPPTSVGKPKSAAADVPTIALNDTMTSAMKDVARHPNAAAPPYQTNAFNPRAAAGMAPGYRPEWEGYPVSSTAQMGYLPPGPPGYPAPNSAAFMGAPPRPAFSTPMPGSAYADQMQYSSAMSGAEMPPMPYSAAAASYHGYQHQMMMRQQGMYMGVPPQGIPTSLAPSMPPHDMSGSPAWQQHQFAARGPPELYPEGLQQRPSWMPQQQPPPATHGMTQPRPPAPQATSTTVKTERFDSGGQRNFRPSSRETSEQNTDTGKEFSSPSPSQQKVKSSKKAAQLHQSAMASQQSSSKLETSLFPPDCVESTRPLPTRKRKWTSKQLGPVEAWRIMMSLKSGLLAECTWAIDALNILLYDNHTITYFHLAQLPGLLDTLVDHYRRCLKDVFTLDHVAEVPRLNNTERDPTSRPAFDDVWVGVCKNASRSFSAVVAASAVQCDDRDAEGFDSDRKYWQSGGGDDTSHILMSFPNRHCRLRTYPRVSTVSDNDAAECRGTGVTQQKNDDSAVAADRYCRTDAVAQCRSCQCSSVHIEDISTFLPSQSASKAKREDNPDRKMTTRDRQCTPHGNDKHDGMGSTTTTEKYDDVSTDDVAVTFTTVTKSTAMSSDENGQCPTTNGPIAKDSTTEDDSTVEDSMATKESSTPGKDSTRVNNSTTKESTTTEESTATIECSVKDSSAEIEDSTAIDSIPGDPIVDQSPDAEERRKLNLDHCEHFPALDELINEGVRSSVLSGATPADDPLLRQIKKELIFDSDCNTEYLESSREFIGYLRKRLKHENRGMMQCDESVGKTTSTFRLTDDAQEFRLRRCVALSNILRSLSFISGNDAELAGHSGLLMLTGSLLLLRHDHPVIDHSEFRLGQDDHAAVGDDTWQDSIGAHHEWWWDGLQELRENSLVVLANISGHLDLSHYQENISLPIIDGLLHWLVCQASDARDAMPTAPEAHALSPKRLALEALAKLSITEGNVDLILATPPTLRLERVFGDLIFGIGIKSCVPSREFCVVLLDNLAHGENAPQLIAAQRSSLSKLLSFLEEAESNTTSFLSSGGIVQPGLSAEEVCGTSVNMLRRTADTLLCLARIVSNRTTFLPFMDRLLSLSMSQMMDTSVLSILSEVMFELR